MAPPPAEIPVERVDCVGGVVVDGRGRLLLVRRGQEPARGLWSVPGGRVEDGESDPEATAREVAEETGLAVEVHELLGTVERSGSVEGPSQVVYVIRDHRCTLTDGVDPASAVAGDDADEVGWFTPAEARALDSVPGLVEALAGWGVL